MTNLWREQEELKMRHDLLLYEKKTEREEARRTKDRLNRLADKITSWGDEDHPSSYHKRLEDIMRDAKIPEDEWPSKLIPLLKGKVLSAYTNNVLLEATGS